MSIGGRYVGTPATRTKPTQVIPVTLAGGFTESFTGSDGNLGTVTTDLVWDVATGNEPLVANNQCTTQSGFGAVDWARSSDQTATTDQYLECDWTATATNSTLWLFVREGTEGGADPSGDEKIAMYINDGGGAVSAVQLVNWNGNNDLGAGSVVSGDVIATWRLEISGNTVNGYRDGVLVLTGDATGYPPSGKHIGFELDSGIGHPTIDNVAFGDL